MNRAAQRRVGHQRLIAACDLPRTLAVLGLLFAVGMFVLVLTRTRPVATGPLTVAAAIGLFAWWSLRNRWTWSVAAMLILTALMTWLTLGQQIPRRGLYGGMQYVWAGNLLLAGAMLLTAILSGARLLAPLKAMLLVVSVAGGLLVSEVALDRFKPRQRYDAAPGNADQPLTFTWQGVASIADEALHWAYMPYGAMKTIYPVNPRGYFEVESRLGPLDMRIWQLNQGSGAKAELIPTPDREGSVGLKVKKIGNGKSWELSMLHSALPIEAGQTYDLTLRAKASRPRALEVLVSHGRPPWKNCGLSKHLELTTDWQDFNASFIATAADEQARLEFQVGNELGDVDVAAVRLTPRPALPGPYGVLRSADWTSIAAPELKADLKPGADGALRAALASGTTNDPWQFMVVHDRIPLRAGKTYVLRGQFRADTARTLVVAVNQAYKPWHNRGMLETLSVEEDWQDVELRFTPKVDERNARLEIQLGGQDIPVEFRNLRLDVERPVAETLSEPPPWALRLKQGYRAELTPADNAPAGARLHVAELPAADAGAILVEHAAEGVLLGDQVTLQFRARAETPRPLTVQVRESRPPWRNLGLTETLELGDAWQTHRLSFTATAADDAASVVFEAGQSDVACELADVELSGPLYKADGREIPADAWKLSAADGVRAKLEIERDSRPTNRCRQNAGKESVPWAAMAQAAVGALRGGQRYVLSLEARAQRPRRIGLAVGPEDDNWSNLQTYQSRKLGAEWQRLNLDFVTSERIPKAGLTLLLGGGDGWVEWRSARLSRTTADSPRHALQYTVTYAMNEHGYRDRPRQRERPADTFRIACLGDSFTFGQGVHAADVFTQRLERQLNATRSADEPNYEVLNYGVCGYDTIQERLVYQRIASQFSPQVVLLVMVENDDMNFSLEREALEDASETRTLRAVDLIRQQNRPRRSDFSGCVTEIGKLRESCQANGAKLAVCVFRNFEGERWTKLIEQVLAGLKGTDVPFLDLGKAILDGRTQEDMLVLWYDNQPLDGHPNELAHEIASRELERFLTEQKLLPRTSATGGQ